MKKTYVLMVLDGFGKGKDYPGNAISIANTPHFDALLDKYPHTQLKASGLAVGLPEGQMGNSEVGHLNLGAGRVMYQELTRITKAIEDGSFFKKREFLSVIDFVKQNDTKMHLIGLLSDGGVHSHNKHLYALLELMKEQGVEDVFIHVILDGRDVPPKSALDYIEELENVIDGIGVGKIATVSGRYYAMDRDNRWERSKLAYDAMVMGKGQRGISPIQIVSDSYEAGITDEFVIPTVVTNDVEGPTATIDTKDGIIFFNFRPDRARQLTRALTDVNFSGFEREKMPATFYVTMTEYDKTMTNVLVAYRNEIPVNTFGQYLSLHGMTQLRTAETEKYPHVTFFFNGGLEEPYIHENRQLIPSPKVATYDMQPEMSAQEVTKGLIEALESEEYDVIIINYANCDMVGHTGVIPAAVKAVETIDDCIGQVMEVLERNGDVAIITADHGNAEWMLDDEGNTLTAHSTNPVPFILVGAGNVELKPGILADVAPTLLDVMGLEKPNEMTGESLIIRR